MAKTVQQTRPQTKQTAAPDVAATNVPGYEAQGFALAQTMQAIVKSHAQDLRRMVTTAWSLDSKARDFAVKYLKEWMAACKKYAQDTRPHEGIDAKQWEKIARTATVRVSQFNTIIRAMNAGMTISTVAGMLGIEQDDVTNVGFDTLVAQAREFLNANAQGSGRGRKADPFHVALAKWLKNHQPEGASAEEMEVFKKVGDIVKKALPASEEAPF